MSQFVFGTGNVVAVSTAAGQTPQQLGTLQDISIGFDFTNVPLLGQYQFPVAVGRGAGKIEGTAKLAEFDANMFNQIFFGTTPVAGGTFYASNEAHSIPASTPWQVTIATPGAGTFLDDGGPVYAATGARFQRVASAPATGQYTVNLATGIYTFTTGDASAAILISYTYTIAASGFSSVLTNQLMGQSTIFKLVLNNQYNNLNFTLELYQVTSTKLTMGFKNTNWSVPDFAFACFTNSANQLGKLSVANL